MSPRALLATLLVLLASGDAGALAAGGYAVITAATGAHALDLLQCGGTPPNLILLDLQMPVMTGEQFLAACQQDPALAAIPLVIVTAFPDRAERLSTSGAKGFIQKPFRSQDLLQAIEKIAA